MPLISDLREFIALLNSNEVEYLVVGAFAVSFHGYPRYTGDLDILVRPTAENAARILQAISEFGFMGLGITASNLQTPEFVLQLGVSPNRIDILTTISGVTFDEAWSARCDAKIDGLETHYIGRNELIRHKEATGRARDLGDADELRKR
ncbi:MAG TPA: hypothetical protein VG897_12020 [Terriglobales bacterium]|nr:hypothetical protein [Terriglobales bacterium]